MNKRLQQLHEFLSETPNDPFLHFALAQEYQKQGQMEKAVAKYEEIYERWPDYVGNYYHYGQALALSGQVNVALSIFQTGIQVATRCGDAHAKRELQAIFMEWEMEAE